jgi:replication-associated recombination protein RarA
VNLSQKYRPREWSELIGLDWLQRQCDTLRQQGGLGGRAFWVAGRSGSGKTTLARLIASEVAEPWATMEMDASDLTAEFLRSVEREYRSRPLGGKGWAFIVNEAHGLKPDQIRKLLTPLDSGSIPPFVVWIFTTTSVAQKNLFSERIDAHPLLSRCEVFDAFTVNTRIAAAYVREIAQTEGLDGRPIEAYVALAQECEGNIRMMLSKVQRGAMKNT